MVTVESGGSEEGFQFPPVFPGTLGATNLTRIWLSGGWSESIISSSIYDRHRGVGGMHRILATRVAVDEKANLDDQYKFTAKIVDGYPRAR